MMAMASVEQLASVERGVHAGSQSAAIPHAARERAHTPCMTLQESILLLPWEREVRVLVSMKESHKVRHQKPR